MRYIHVFTLSAVMSAVLILAAREAAAQDRPVGGVPRNNFTGQAGHFGGSMHGGRFRGFGNGIWVVDREVEVPVYVEVPVAVPAPPPSASADGPPPRSGENRKPYVIGASYDSLPGSCMKLIEEGVSFYYCSGEWYREVRAGRNPLYRAVARKL